MEVKDHIVQFDKYCKDCKYFEVFESEDPCDDCLSQPTNQNSYRPVRFVKKED